MADCPVCGNQYIEEQDKVCSVCEWDLTLQSPSGLKGFGVQWGVPGKALEEFQKKVNDAAKKIWNKLSQEKKEIELKLKTTSDSAEQIESKLEELKKQFNDMEAERNSLAEQVKTLAEKEDTIRSEKEQLNDALKVCQENSGQVEILIEPGIVTKIIVKSSDQHYQVKTPITDDKVPDINSNISSSKREGQLADEMLEIDVSNAGIINPTEEGEEKVDTTDYDSVEDASSDEENIVNRYNQSDDFLKYAITVSETKESQIKRRGGSHESAIFERENNGNYWIVKTESNNWYALPKRKLKINEHNYGTVNTLFECQGYESRTTGNFQLIKPVKVVEIADGQQWQVTELGTLKFE